MTTTPYTHDSWTDVAFVRATLQDETVTSVAVAPWSGGGGMHCQLFFLTVERTKDEQVTSSNYFLKVPPANTQQEALMGTPREAFFYRECGSLLGSVLPGVVFAQGDMATGQKVLLLEQLAGVQGGYFYGAHSPHNIGRDLAELTREFPGTSHTDVTVAAFQAIARVHAMGLGRCAELAQEQRFATAKGGEWVSGEGHGVFDASLAHVRGAWSKLGAHYGAEAPEADRFDIDAAVVALVDAAFERTTWESVQSTYKHPLATLIHSDFHPSNVVVTPGGAAPTVRIIDWEAFGFGLGPQDLGQYVISHSRPEDRRAEERPALEAYVATLHELGHTWVKYEAVYEAYVCEGLGRFFWMLPILVSMKLPAPLMKYFHDQVKHFAEDHGVTTKNPIYIRL